MLTPGSVAHLYLGVGEGGGGRVLVGIFGGVRGSVLQTRLTLLQRKKCYFPVPFSTLGL